VKLKTSESRIKQLKEYTDTLTDMFVEEVTNVCQIAAPSYQEDKRAEYVAKRMKDFGFSVVIILQSQK